MDNLEGDLSWLTQSSGDSNPWKKPETAQFIRYVYDDDEYIDPVGNEVVIHQHLPDNNKVRLQDIQNGLIDNNFDTYNPPVVGLESHIDSTCSTDCADQQTQCFGEPVSDDDLLNMQRKM